MVENTIFCQVGFQFLYSELNDSYNSDYSRIGMLESALLLTAFNCYLLT